MAADYFLRRGLANWEMMPKKSPGGGYLGTSRT
jgi:hypothetical protein